MDGHVQKNCKVFKISLANLNHMNM